MTLDELQRAIPVGVACVQNPYNLLSRGDQELLRLCTPEGIAWVPYFPLGGSFPGMPSVADEPAVQAAAHRLGVTPAQIGLAWLLQQAPNTLIIAGTSSVAHLEENVAVGAVELDDEAVADLDALRS